MPGDFGPFIGPDRYEAIWGSNLDSMIDAAVVLERSPPQLEPPKVIPNEDADALLMLASLSAGMSRETSTQGFFPPQEEGPSDPPGDWEPRGGFLNPISDRPQRLRSELAGRTGWDTISNSSGTAIERSLAVVATLGHGSLGLVEEVEIPGVNGISFVRKRVLLPHHRRVQRLAIVQAEAKIVEDLVHTHIIHIIGTYETTPKTGVPSFSLLMWPVAQKDLSAFLNEYPEDQSNKQERKTWLVQWPACLISALAYIHSQGIRHQDIKPSNIICHATGKIFFTDFSSSARFNPLNTTSTENPARTSAMYSASEVLDRLDVDDTYQRHGTGSDIFSLGCVFIEMLVVRAGYSVEKFHACLAELDGRAGLPYAHMLDSTVAFIMSMTEFNRGFFLVEVVRDMVKKARKERPSAQLVKSRISDWYGIRCTCAEP
ncbi:kinase-like domain-containing protein [Massariosphaeria phaeospora]|uniref:non-specific serine/threonine protein kinase n=1 Tax=Massariosphaeria phaeospora TaxID=100035 RepID=A0A7C8MG59_9PLEO|nr:kinase-like domain-containing protein [Massariosphaeria phaeospora]